MSERYGDICSEVHQECIAPELRAKVKRLEKENDKLKIADITLCKWMDVVDEMSIGRGEHTVDFYVKEGLDAPVIIEPKRVEGIYEAMRQHFSAYRTTRVERAESKNYELQEEVERLEKASQKWTCASCHEFNERGREQCAGCGGLRKTSWSAKRIEELETKVERLEEEKESYRKTANQMVERCTKAEIKVNRLEKEIAENWVDADKYDNQQETIDRLEEENKKLRNEIEGLYEDAAGEDI